MATLIERFTRKYVCRLDSKCWEWIGSMDGQPRGGHNPRGRYGRFALDGYNHMGAHKASYLIHKGEIPAGMQVCHSCDNPVCVNPDHLWTGTIQENMDDQVAKGRNAVKNGFKPRLGTGLSHKVCGRAGQFVATTCSQCGNSMDQQYQSFIRGKRACCSAACKGRALSASAYASARKRRA